MFKPVILKYRKTRAWVVHLQNKYLFKNIVVLSTDLDNIVGLRILIGYRLLVLTVPKPIFCEPGHRGVRLLGNTVGVANGTVVPKKQATTTMHEVIDIGKIASTLGDKQYASFRAILCMGKTDFVRPLTARHRCFHYADGNFILIRDGTYIK